MLDMTHIGVTRAPAAEAPTPNLSPAAARSVVRGACKALGESDVPGLPPSGLGLSRLARALETMHEDPDPA